jgi:hypothetical protein
VHEECTGTIKVVHPSVYQPKIFKPLQTVSVIHFIHVYVTTGVFSSSHQATFVASGGWPHWCIFEGNCSYLQQK